MLDLGFSPDLPDSFDACFDAASVAIYSRAVEKPEDMVVPAEKFDGLLMVYADEDMNVVVDLLEA